VEFKFDRSKTTGNRQAQTWDKPVRIPYLVSEKELQEAKLIAEEAKRAWREEHDARVEAEEAKAAVIKTAEEAIAEATELKKKLAKELDDTKQKNREAVQARKLFEEAKSLYDEAKSLWREACRTRITGHIDESKIIAAEQAQQRAEYILKWVE